MAIQQLVPIYVNLKGDGSATAFVFALQNLYQFSNGAAIPFGGAGVVPTSVSVGESNFTGGTTTSSVDANGNITVTFGAAVASGAVVTVRLDLTFNSPAGTSSSATQTTNVTVVGSSTVTIGAGSAVIGHVITDTGSTTAVTGTVTTSDTNLVSQGSTTSGQKGPLILGAVTTGAPSYTTAQTSPLSLDTSGNLRVSGSFSSGALADLVGTTSPLNALNATATINAFGYESVGMFLAAGTLQGTIVPEASLDGGTTWVATNFLDPLTNATVASYVFASNNTATSASIVTVGGASNYRVRVSAFTSGTANATLRANEVSSNTTIVTQPTAANLNATIVQGTAANLNATVVFASAQPVTLTSTTITGTVAVTQSTSPWVTNMTQWASTALGTPTNFGSTPGAVVAGSVNASLFVGTTAVSSAAPLPSTLSGSVVAVSLTAVGQTAVINMLNLVNASVVITSLGTGGTLATEVSIDNGVTWQIVDVWRESTEQYVNTNPAITVADSYWFEQIGAIWFARVRVVALTSGTITGTLIGTVSPNMNFEYTGVNGSTLPNNIAAVGGSDGTNVRALATDTSGNQKFISAIVNPVVVQAGHTATANASTALANAFASNNTAGNSIVVVVGVGSGTAPTSITDTLNTIAAVGNQYRLVAFIPNGATFSTYIYLLTGCLPGANTVTVNTASSTVSSIIYEVSGNINLVSAAATQTATSAQAATPPVYPLSQGDIAFQAIAIGTAAQTITSGTNWTGLAQVNSPVTPTGLFTLGAQYQINPSMSGVTPQATFTSEPWASAAAIFHVAQQVPVSATTVATPVTTLGNSFSGVGAGPGSGVIFITTAGATLLKASPGNLYGMTVVNLLSTSTSGGIQYVKFYDAETAAGAALANWKFTIALAAPSSASTSAVLSIPPGALALANFASGIVVSISTTSAQTTTTGSANYVGTFWVA